MLFYYLELDDKSKDMCTINNCFSLYRYVRLPMGVKVLSGITQSIINKILDRTGAEGYIDNCVYWSNDSFDYHLIVADKF